MVLAIGRHTVDYLSPSVSRWKRRQVITVLQILSSKAQFAVKVRVLDGIFLALASRVVDGEPF